MLTTCSIKSLCKVCVVVLAVMVMGCASTIPKAAVTGAQITLPADPPALVVDSGQIDKSKFPPNTRYVKPPVPDNEKGRAYWSFGDVDKINEALVLRQKYIKDAKEIVEGHNKLVGGDGGRKPSGTSWFHR